MKKKSKETSGFIFNSNTIWLFLIIMSFSTTAYYLLFPAEGYFHADCADTIFWANAGYEAGGIYDDTFTYACLLPFGGNLIMQPLVAIFGVSMTAHVIGMFIFLLLFSVFLLLMLKEMKWSLKWSAIMYSVLILTVSSSEKLREIFWGHMIYYSLGVLFIFAGLAIVFKLINKTEKGDFKNQKKSLIIWLTILFVWFFLCCTNQIMAITIFAFPVIMGLAGELFFDLKSKPLSEKNIFSYLMIAVMCIGMCGGYLFANFLSNDIVAGYEDAYSRFSASDKWLENAMSFPKHWLTLLGVTISDGDAIMSIDGIAGLLRIVFAVVISTVPIAAIFAYPKIKERHSKIIIITHWIVTALIAMGYIFGKLSAANWRLSPIVCTSVITTIVFVKWLFENTDCKRIGGLIMCPITIVCLLIAAEILQMPADYGRDNALHQISEYLVEKELSYGYATFWNAGSVTVISDSKATVRNVNVNSDGSVTPYYYQSSKRWFEDVEGQEDYFLLLTDSEYDTLLSNNSDLLNKCISESSCSDFHILVFSENIF